MFRGLMLLLTWFLEVFGKKILLALGLGLATGGALLAVLNYYINKVQQQAGLMGDMAQLLKIGGFDTALSIIAGAMVVRATMVATQVSLTKVSK